MGQRHSEADGSMREYGLREPDFIGGEVDLSINIYRGQGETKDHNDFINANKVPDTTEKVPNSADGVPDTVEKVPDSAGKMPHVDTDKIMQDLSG